LPLLANQVLEKVYNGNLMTEVGSIAASANTFFVNIKLTHRVGDKYKERIKKSRETDVHFFC